MGKSGKKIKSDRINALRKQYDVFLEEDRKRKERNEIILERLDKMRSCTSVVPLQSNIVGNVIENSQVTKQNRPGFCSKQQLILANNPTKYLDETYILKEISKKYILIPRLNAIQDNYINCIPSDKSSVTYNDTTDWKNKYEILDQLKRNEKEEPTEEYFHRNKEPVQYINENEQIFENNERDKVVSKPSSYDHQDLPEQDNFHSEDFEVVKEFNRDPHDNKKLDYQMHNTENISKNNETNYKLHNSNNQIKCQPSNTENKTEKEILNVMPLQENVNDKTKLKQLFVPIAINPELELRPKRDKKNDSGEPEESISRNLFHNNSVNEIKKKDEQIEPNAYEYELELRPGHDIKNDSRELENPIARNLFHNESVTEIKKDDQIETNAYEYEQQNDLVTNEQYVSEKKINDNIDRPENVTHLDSDNVCSTQVINSVEMFTKINNDISGTQEPQNSERLEYPIDIIDSQQFTPNDNVILQDGTNINPEEYTVNQDNVYQYNIQNTVVSENPDNVAEISGIEEFNAEQREMFYSEQSDQNYETYDEGANVEHSAQIENEQYGYYEGAQHDTYPEINEHEETSQRYDQSYEQQFTNYEQHQEYEQQQEYEQTEHYETDGYDQTKQDYNEYQQEEQNYETVDNVEQQLDHEQGYNNIPTEQSEIEAVLTDK